MIYLVILTIIILFFVFALIINPILKKFFAKKICAICAACSSTWIALLVLRQLDVIEIDNVIIGVLMGGSVVGIMEELEEYFKKKRIKSFWIVRILEVAFGFMLAYSVAVWDVCNILTSGLVLILTSLLTLMFIKKSDQKKVKSNEKNAETLTDEEKEDAIKKLEKSLEDCC